MKGMLREKLFDKQYKKLINSKGRTSTSTPSVNTFASATILATYRRHTREMLLQTPEYFRKMGIPCEIYVVKEKTDAIDADPNIHLIDTADCSWYGVPSQEILIDWLANKADLLIVSDPDQLPVIKYLCAASNSKLKTSITTADGHPDTDIDFWVEVKEIDKISLVEQCKITYKTLSQIGVRPPVIG